MFTGIIETMGIVEEIRLNGSNKEFTISSAISNELKVDQSLAHNGVCLTVTAIENGKHHVTSIDETLLRSNLGALKIGESINLERAKAIIKYLEQRNKQLEDQQVIMELQNIRENRQAAKRSKVKFTLLEQEINVD